MKKLLGLALIGYLVVGCTGIGVYQPPRVLKKGESMVGVGTPLLFLSFEGGNFAVLPLPELYFRFGIADKTDIGFRSPFIIATEEEGIITLSADIRMGLSNSSPQIIPFFQTVSWIATEGGAITFLAPGVFMGTQKSLVGLQYVVPTGNIEDVIESESNLIRFFWNTSFKSGKLTVRPGVSFVAPISSKSKPLIMTEIAFDIPWKKR